MARTGVHAVGHIFTDKFGWIFREQHESDFGIDAQAEVVDAGRATGKLVALQIKSGPSHLRERGEVYVYHGELRHLDYWLNHVLPVFLIFHDPDKNQTLWKRVEDAAVKRTNEGWSIEVPRTNVLDETARATFEKVRELTEEEKRRERLKEEIGLIEAIQRSVTSQVTITVDDNEDISVSGIEVVCKDEAGKSIYRSTTGYGDWLGYYTANEAIQQEYWFLNYDYAEEVYVGDEYENHIFDVRVKPAVLGYLEVEKILKDGPPETVEPEDIPYRELTFEETFHEALRRDWAAEAGFDREDDWKD